MLNEVKHLRRGAQRKAKQVLRGRRKNGGVAQDDRNGAQGDRSHVRTTWEGRGISQDYLVYCHQGD